MFSWRHKCERKRLMARGMSDLDEDALKTWLVDALDRMCAACGEHAYLV